jgi:hypothetical protein
MNQQILTYNISAPFDIFTDSTNYLPNFKEIGNNEIFPIGAQSGTGYDIVSVSISLDVLERINTASDTAKEINKPIPNNTSKSTSWLTSRLLAKYKRKPTFVNATYEGGIMLEYHLKNDLYIMLEFFNDGDIVCLIKMNGVRKTYSFVNGQELQLLLQTILNGGSLQQSKNTKKTTQK